MTGQPVQCVAIRVHCRAAWPLLGERGADLSLPAQIDKVRLSAARHELLRLENSPSDDRTHCDGSRECLKYAGSRGSCDVSRQHAARYLSLDVSPQAIWADHMVLIRRIGVTAGLHYPVCGAGARISI